MRVHVVSLPHTLLTKAFDWCAYTAKVRRFVSMLAKAGHEPIVYGPDEHELQGFSEYVEVVNARDRVRWFGAPQWNQEQVFASWDPEAPCWRTMNALAAAEIRRRWEPGDVLGLIGGRCQEQIFTDLQDLQPLTIEWGIGYSGVLTGTHKVFESYAWRHHVAGLQKQDDLAFYDTVIPNCFDRDDFQFSDLAGDYVVFMGRPIPRKGTKIVQDIAERISLPVLQAGQLDGTEPIPGCRHVGLVTGQEKAELLANARCVLVPTTYLEPFGGVAVEAMMSGTPVVTTDWGAFTETVQHGVNGFRCNTLRDFLTAVDLSADLDRGSIRDHAHESYSTDTGAELYDRYLKRLSSLQTEGWYAGT